MGMWLPRSFSESIGPVVHWSSGPLVSCCVGRWVHSLAGRSVRWSNRWSVCPVGMSVGRFVGPSVGPSVGRSAGRLTIRPTHRVIVGRTGRPTEKEKPTQNGPTCSETQTMSGSGRGDQSTHPVIRLGPKRPFFLGRSRGRSSRRGTRRCGSRGGTSAPAAAATATRGGATGPTPAGETPPMV